MNQRNETSVKSPAISPSPLRRGRGEVTRSAGMKLQRSFPFLLTFLLFFFLPPVLKVQSQTSDSTLSVKFFTRANAGAGFGIGYFKTDVRSGHRVRIKDDEILYSVSSINGILFSGRTGLGVGVGVEPWKDGLFFPITLHVFSDFEPKENTFFGEISAGYSFGKRYSTVFYESGTGAFKFNLGIGYKMVISKRLKFEYEIFYNYQVIRSKYNNYLDSAKVKVVQSDYTVPYHFAGFRLGIEYH